MKPKSARGDWIKQVRFDMQFAEKTLLKQGGIGAMFVVHTKDAQYAIVAPWRDDDDKAAYFEFIRTFCIAHDAEALTYIAEAWTRHLQQAPRETDAEYEARVNAVRPRDAEDRIEMVICMCMHRDDAGQRQVISDSRVIERRVNGKPTGLKPHRLNEGLDIVAGAVVEAFPEWPPSLSDRMTAQVILKAGGVIER